MEQRKPHWVPVHGTFNFSDTEVVFPGGTTLASRPNALPGAPQEEQAVFGLAFSDFSLADGDVSAVFEFSQITKATVGELVVSYDVNAQHIVNAGIGGDQNSMFSIREFMSNNREWDYPAVRGTRESIQAKHGYAIDASFRGNLVTLRIDGVPVASCEVTSPTGRPRQVGVFCKGEHPIIVRSFRVNARKPKAFVVMQFGSQYDDVYKDVVKGVCDSYEVSPLRADEVSGPGIIIADIIREISSAQLIIADITPINANVYFEVGYALAMNKPTILLAKKGTPLPFDVAGFRVLFYEDSIGGKGKLEEGLRRHLAAILSPLRPESAGAR